MVDHELSRAYRKTWVAMEHLVDKGKARLIGITIRDADSALQIFLTRSGDRPLKLQHPEDQAHSGDR